MASVLCSEDLTCAVCLTIFTDPVTLLCGHSFCRQCITDVLDTQQQCPQCGTAVATEAQSLPTSFILKSLAEKTKEAERMKKEPGCGVQVAELCPEHEEKLKLFCVTDQQLACIICRDGEKHEGHKFKPIKEAAASLRKELEMFVQHVSADIQAVESQADAQRAETTKTKEKSQHLMIQIRRQFEEMHQFLRKREDEMKNELKLIEEEDIEKMSKSFSAIETALSESRELEAKAASVLNVTDSERFLKSWTEENNMTAPEDLLRSRAIELQVVNSSLSMGLYESHLQFFVWKEMLQVIQPRAEPLSLQTSSPNVIISNGGRSLFWKRQTTHPASGFSFGFGNLPPNQGLFGQPPYSPPYQSTSLPSDLDTNHAFSVREFTSGQHYWEVEVGSRDYWEVGIQDHFFKYDGKKYAFCGPNTIIESELADRPQKIGIYLNCSSKKLSFYDAETMTRFRTMRYNLESQPALACFNIRYRDPDYNPVTVCWY